MAVRVLRMLEYTYPDNETAEKDMGRWGVAANGHRSAGPMTVRSAVIIDLGFDEGEPVPWFQPQGKSQEGN